MILVISEFRMNEDNRFKFLKKLEDFVFLEMRSRFDGYKYKIGISIEGDCSVFLYQEFKSLDYFAELKRTELWEQFEIVKKDLILSERIKIFEKIDLNSMAWCL